MDRLQFTSGINYSVSNAHKPKEICKHFDEIMCLYDVMKQIDSSIDANIDNEKITFSIQTKSTEDSCIIMQRINNITICKFDNRYIVDGDICGNTININIIKTSVSG